LNTDFYNSGSIFYFVKQNCESISAERKIAWLKKHFFSPHIIPATSVHRWKNGLKTEHKRTLPGRFSSIWDISVDKKQISG